MAEEHAPDSPGSLGEPASAAYWTRLYQQAIQELAGGKQQFDALFTGDQFDLAITFRRMPKGSLRESARRRALGG